MNKFVLLVALCFFCPSQEATIDNLLGNNDSQTTKVKDIPIPTLQVGANFETQSNFPMGNTPCLAFTQDNITYHNPEAIIYFQESIDFSTLQSVLGVQVSGGGGWGIFGGGAGFSYTRSQLQSTYSLNINYAYQYSSHAVLKLDSNKTGPDLLSAEGRDHYNYSSEDFAQYCGDSFVQEATAGISLAVFYSLQFRSQLDKEAFSGSLSLGFGLFDMASSINRAQQTSGVSIVLNIKAVQIGGEPQNLNQIFGQNGSYPIFQCSLSDGTINVNACQDAVSKIMDYANTVGNFTTNGIQTQIKVDSSGHAINPDSFYYTSPIATTWDQIGASPGRYPPDVDMIEAQKELITWYNLDTTNYTFLEHMIPLVQSKNASPLMVYQLQQIATNVSGRILAYSEEHVTTCFMGGFNTMCKKIHDNMQVIRNATYPVNETLLKYFGTAYQMIYQPSTWVYPIDANGTFVLGGDYDWIADISYDPSGNMLFTAWNNPQSAVGILEPYEDHGMPCYVGMIYNNTGDSYNCSLCGLPNPM